MNTLMILLFLACIICAVIGIIKPTIVIKWGDPSKVTRKKAVLSYGIGAVIFFILFGFTIPKEYKTVGKEEVSTNTIEDNVKDSEDEDKSVEDEKVNEDIIITTDFYEKTFKIFSDRVGNSSFEADKKVIETIGYTTEITEPDDEKLATIKVEDGSGNYVTLMYYPENGIEKLTLLSYGRDNCSITITNDLHTIPVEYVTYNIDDEQRNKNVSSLSDLEKFMFVDMKNVTSNISTDKINAYIDVTTKFNDSGKVYFEIASNLPDETKLMLTLSDGESYSAQSSVVVKDGKVTSEAFSNKGNVISSGSYTLKISMPLAVVQPDSVRKLIGNNGENLIGDLVVSGIDGESKTVTKEIEVLL